MQNFADLDAMVDDAVFNELADDQRGVWTPRGRTPVTPIRVILEDVEQHAVLATMNLPHAAHAVRLLAREIETLAPGVDPGEGDGISLNKGAFVIRGHVIRDGGDWLCVVSAA